jgi:hypothetical protein
MWQLPPKYVIMKFWESENKLFFSQIGHFLKNIFPEE